MDSVYAWKKDDSLSPVRATSPVHDASPVRAASVHDASPVRAASPVHDASSVRAASSHQWSPTFTHHRSINNQDTSVFDFDDDVNNEPTRILSKRTSFEKKLTPDAEQNSLVLMSVPTVTLTRVHVPLSSVEDEVCFNNIQMLPGFYRMKFLE